MCAYHVYWNISLIPSFRNHSMAVRLSILIEWTEKSEENGQSVGNIMKKLTFHDSIQAPYFILSSDLINGLLNYVYRRRPFHIDDAYVGVAMRDLGINATKIHTFHVTRRFLRFMRTVKDCDLIGRHTFGDNVDANLCRVLHRRLESLVCRKDISLEC